MVAAVDIILPTHARPHTIGYSIAAVLQQSHPELVLHVVGDGIDDATAAAVAAFDDPRLRLHRFAKARGYGYANRNRVLRATAAPYIAYANDDDLWFPDHLERALAQLERRGVELIAMRELPVQPPDAVDPYFFAFDWRRWPARHLRNWFTGSGTLVHRRRVFEAVGYWNEQLYRFGDREFYNRVRRSPLPTARSAEPTVLRFYAQHWEAHYAALAEPPQRRYLRRVADPEWRAAARAAAAPGRRSLVVRRRQWTEFARFALHSGPKLLRFWYERGRHGGCVGSST